MNLPKHVEITEVGPRDGFQNIKEWIPTKTKLELIEQIISCGFKKIEVTAFVHPKAVPQMADADKILTTLKSSHPDIFFIALAPNLKGVANAVKAGADQINYIVSASGRHNFENTRQTIDQSLKGLEEVCRMKEGTKIGLAVPTAFNCPWTGPVPVENVIKIIEYGLSAGVDDIGIADTIGSANPVQVSRVIHVLKDYFLGINISLHFHDTRGMGLANIVSALQAGATRFETSIGALGGCPFAPGAAGNIATEDLIHMLHEMGIETGINLKKVMDTVFRAEEVLPVQINSHMAKAVSCEAVLQADRSR